MQARSMENLSKLKGLILNFMPLSCKVEAVQAINSVMLAEDGPAAVLTPHNNQTGRILALWHKGLMPQRIALELGLAQDTVESVIEDPANYLMTMEQAAHL